MYKEVLAGIKDISIYPVLSFVVFFAFFLIMSLWVIKSKSKDFDGISNLPLNDNQNDGIL